MKSMKRMVPAVLVVAAAATPIFAQQQPPPRFQAGIELLPIDVTVVDDAGKPIEHLAPGDFTVRVDDQPRRVVNAQWVPRLTAGGTQAAALPASVSDGYFSNAGTAGGGLVVIAVDEANIKFGGMRPMLPAVTRFIDRLPAADRIAIFSFGLGSSTGSEFTANRDTIKEKLAQMPGQITGANVPWSYRVGIGAALAHHRGEPEALSTVIRRACSSAQVQRIAQDCPLQVRLEAGRIAEMVLRNADLTIRGLRELLTALKPVDAPKTLLLISDGFGLDRSILQRRIVELGELAASARTTIYSLKLEEEPTDITEPVARSPFEVQQDQYERRFGLELLAHAARGGLFTMSGTGTGALDRVESEMSGHYLLGVESTARDREGTLRTLQVTVARPDVTVRARQTMAVDPRTAPQTAHDRLNAALTNPLVLSALALRGTAVALRGPDRSKVQVLVHADVDVARTGARVVSVGYVVLDKDWRAVEGQISDIPVAAPERASPMRYSRAATVAPGSYTVRIAVVDGDLAGSVEFPFRAELMRSGSLDVTDLMVGGPEPPGNPSQPVLGPEVRFGLVQGYLEAYGASAAGLSARFEVVTADDRPAVLSTSVPARRGGDERFIFSKVLPVGELPPGAYRLRSTLAASTPVVRSRPFEVAAPPANANALYLTVSASDLGRPFDLDAALHSSTVEPMRARLPAQDAAAFDAALLQLRDRAFVDAATALERVMQGGASPGAPLAYLGVCFAAAGHDGEAITAWRKALTAGTDVPEVHAWLVDALLRTKRFGEGRTATEAAQARWPSDGRFARPLAILRATGGGAREAVLALDRYLEQQRNDEASLFLALNWMVEARRAGVAVHDRSEDIRLARHYAAQYAALNGARQALVQLWVEYLER
jgi:VWFA-related protein